MQCASQNSDSKHVTFNPVPQYLVYDSSSMVSETMSSQEPGPPSVIIGSEGGVCQIHSVPWPLIIMVILGLGLVLYTALLSGNIASARRNFSILLLLLWTLLWSMLLWVLWRQCEDVLSWWLLVFSSIIIITFFILVVALNLGG